ncbi:unnamed protein product, partial [Prorocentrum cordatum]
SPVDGLHQRSASRRTPTRPPARTPARSASTRRPRELPHGVREAAPRCRPVLPRGRLARRRLFPRGGARRTGSCRGRARGGARRRRWSSTSRAAWTPRRAGRCSRCGTSCARRCTLSARWWQGAPRLRGNVGGGRCTATPLPFPRFRLFGSALV